MNESGFSPPRQVFSKFTGHPENHPLDPDKRYRDPIRPSLMSWFCLSSNSYRYFSSFKPLLTLFSYKSEYLAFVYSTFVY